MLGLGEAVPQNGRPCSNSAWRLASRRIRGAGSAAGTGRIYRGSGRSRFPANSTAGDTAASKGSPHRMRILSVARSSSRDSFAERAARSTSMMVQRGSGIQAMSTTSAPRLDISTSEKSAVAMTGLDALHAHLIGEFDRGGKTPERRGIGLPFRWNCSARLRIVPPAVTIVFQNRRPRDRDVARTRRLSRPGAISCGPQEYVSHPIVR